MCLTHLNLDSTKLAAFCQQNDIKRMSLFGSVISKDFKPSSDIDIIVEFEDQKTPGLIKFSGIMLDLFEHFFNNRKIDLLTRNMLKGELGDIILKSSEVIYEKAAKA
ncbi:MAG: nucleotidyltransferase domain-containing protein [Oligoflexales bacterium]|nr:nucleotidyltransferase domain-containing protein [Oligoflexales bacterium]